MKRKKQGFTLIELLFTTVIFITLFSLAIPSWQAFSVRAKVSANLRKIHHLIQFSRQVAITRNVRVTLCKSADQSTCAGDWSEGIMVFTDLDGDRTLDAEDELLMVKNAIMPNDRLTWRSFRSRNFLQIAPSGFTAASNGTFRYCPAGYDKLARALIVSKTGRPRISSDADGDGWDEDASGEPVTCL